MGYFLIFEGMLDSILFARDKYLAPNGLLFPNKCRIKLAAFEDSKYYHDKFKFWTNNPYGVNFKHFQDQMIEEMFIEAVPYETIFTESCIVLDVDINTVTKE
jgi:protein arginine N-methyltransferase 1